MMKTKNLVTIVLSVLLAVSLIGHSANAASGDTDNIHVIRVTKSGGGRSLEVITVSESFDITVDTGYDSGDLISVDCRYASREKISVTVAFGHDDIKDRMYTKEFSVYNPDGIDYRCRTTEVVQQDDTATCVLSLREISEEERERAERAYQAELDALKSKAGSMWHPKDEHDEETNQHGHVRSDFGSAINHEDKDLTKEGPNPADMP